MHPYSPCVPAAIIKKGNIVLRKIRQIFFIILCFCLLVTIMADSVPRAHAASAMTASNSCVDYIKAVEGFSAYPYYDYSQYTVGYGTMCPSPKYFEYTTNGITEEEAEILLQEEVAKIEDALNNKLIDKYNLTFSQHQFDALVSFTFNIGPGWITSDSTLKNAIVSNASANDLVYAFGLYSTAGGKYLTGLINRRLCEANMYLNGVYSQKVNNDFGYVCYDANGGSVTYQVQAFIHGSNSVPVADAARTGDVFSGWYTDLIGGTRVTTLNRNVSGKTLFAHWEVAEDIKVENPAVSTVKVTGDVVNIRSGPSTSYGITARAYRNEVLTVSHVTNVTNMKWGKVPNGWICLDYTNYDQQVSGNGNAGNETTDIPSVDETVPDNSTAENDSTNTPPNNTNAISGTVNVNDVLNIRSGPGTAYSTVGFLFRGTKVNILEQTTVGSTPWGRIEKGWVCMTYIVTDTASSGGTITPAPDAEQPKEPVQQAPESTGNTETTSITGKITADALRIRSSAGTTSPIVGHYYQNDVVTVTERTLVGSVYWGKTSKGWISMEYVTASSSNTESQQPAENGTKTVIGDCLRVRKEAGTVYKIVGFLYYGDKVTILETKDVNGTPWGRISNGWICMDYVV